MNQPSLTVGNTGVIANTYPSLKTTTFDFNPLQIAGLSLWIDASDRNSYSVTGTTVNSIRDKSPRNWGLGTATTWITATFNTNYTAFQVNYTAGTIPTFPSGTLGVNTAFALTTPFTTFVVAHANISTQSGFIMDSATAAEFRPYIWLISMATPYANLAANYWQNPAIGTFGFVDGTNTAYTYPNGDTSVQVVGTLATSTTNGIRIGNRGTDNQAWPGLIAEILMYSGNLSLFDRQRVEGYLANKWGLRANLPASHPYKNVAPTSNNPALGPSTAILFPAMKTQ